MGYRVCLVNHVVELSNENERIQRQKAIFEDFLSCAAVQIGFFKRLKPNDKG